MRLICIEGDGKNHCHNPRVRPGQELGYGDGRLWVFAGMLSGIRRMSSQQFTGITLQHIYRATEVSRKESFTCETFITLNLFSLYPT